MHFKISSSITSLVILCGCGINTPRPPETEYRPTFVYQQKQSLPQIPPEHLKAVALKERSDAITDYNKCKYNSVHQKINSWKMENEILQSNIIGSPGDAIIFYTTEIAFNTRESFQNLIKMSGSYADETTDTIIGTSIHAWPEYSNWLSCYFNERKARNCQKISRNEIRTSICQNFRNSLIKKYSPAQKLVD